MTDEPQTLKTAGKNPMDNAADKLREALAKEGSKKVEDQLKKTVAAVQAARNEEAELERVIAESDKEKATLNDILKGLK